MEMIGLTNHNNFLYKKAKIFTLCKKVVEGLIVKTSYTSFIAEYEIDNQKYKTKFVWSRIIEWL